MVEFAQPGEVGEVRRKCLGRVKERLRLAQGRWIMEGEWPLGQDTMDVAPTCVERIRGALSEGKVQIRSLCFF